MKARRNLIQVGLLCVLMLQALTSGAQPVTKITAGGVHSLFLKNDGSLWAMGDNAYGQLGGGTNNSTNRPKQISASNVTAIAVGSAHSLLLKSDGSLCGMGDTFYGELGAGLFNNNIYSPLQIVGSNVTAIAAGYTHSLILQSDGSLWATGYNYWGQLGDGTYSTNNPYNETNRFEQIVASNVTAIAAGYMHSLFLKGNGSLWAMGFNGDGELGDGAVGILPDGSYNRTNVPEMIVASNVTAIAAGGHDSLFLKKDGSLWGMGDDAEGQLGTDYGTNRPEQIVASNVTAIATGGDHSLFLKNDGSLWAMGFNLYGQLGDSADTQYSWSTNRPEQIVASNVTAIAAGDNYSLFLKSDGSLWAMGRNEYGQLGDGTSGNGNYTNRIELIVAAYNRISGQLVSGNNMQLSFVGIANAKYALDRSSSLSPPNWIPQLTNVASSYGPLVFTNPPDATTNNFWRIRSVQ